jgi:hypothetical protein
MQTVVWPVVGDDGDHPFGGWSEATTKTLPGAAERAPYELA